MSPSRIFFLGASVGCAVGVVFGVLLGVLLLRLRWFRAEHESMLRTLAAVLEAVKTVQALRRGELKVPSKKDDASGTS